MKTNDDGMLVPKGTGSIAINNIPKPAGYWVFSNGGALVTRIHVVKKPLWIHRFFMYALLGIRWEDSKIK